MKTHKAASKKVKLTATGLVMHRKCGKRKSLSFKTSKRKRRLGRSATLSSALAHTVKRLIGAN